jgi:4-alpha-glucanotransferase
MADQKTSKNKLKTNGWGVDLNYRDALGEWHDTPAATVDAILLAAGAEPGLLTPEQNDSLIVVRSGEQRALTSSATIELESGETLYAEAYLPADLPTGYHRIQLSEGAASTGLIVSPGKCWLPEDLRTWGWGVQLYAARSRASWGIGDFGDLDRLAKWSADELGAGMMLVNPLSAAAPITPQQASPYYPTSRRFFNPLWINVEWVPGAEGGLVPQLEGLAQAGRELNSDRHIDRDKVFDLKMRALELLWLQFAGDASFERFCLERGSDLHVFAAFCTLAEFYKTGWHAWPEQYRHPSNSAVAQFAAEHQNRVLFYKWLQWLLDKQLARCAARIPLMQDLPIGVDPDGADAWAWQDVLAPNIAVGAPPDEFNTQGQNWGLPPFVPHKLRAVGYEPLIQTIRAAFRHGGGLRIDHVMGLFRLFWIPNGKSGAEGAYVRYNGDEMLSIVALESERAKAYVVGEDLGTVEDEVRQKLASYRVMSYRLLWFEKDLPASYPTEALAAVTTHDLPTVAGLWTGSDLKKQRELGMKPNEESTAEIHDRLSAAANLSNNPAIDEVIIHTYGLLAQAPSRILVAALDDAAMVEERPNMPAAEGNPNWSLALPEPIEDLIQTKLPQQIAVLLRRKALPRRTSDGLG